MLKKIAVAAIAILACFSFAQITVSPTVGNGDDQFDTGANSASVQQNVNLILPAAVALHLDVSELDFDLELLGSEDAPYVCVYGNSLTDLPGGSFNGQEQTLPLGTSYWVANTWSLSEAPIIEILDAAGLATSYPPAAFDGEADSLIGESPQGELIPGSKNHFVCYQTFILQKFSNHSNWELTVTRGGTGAFDMYIQDNTFCSFNAVTPTGFFQIAQDQTINLLPASLTGGTTGALAEACGQDGKSWLDDLVVVAVKVNGDPYGTNTATLTYTIQSVSPNEN